MNISKGGMEMGSNPRSWSLPVVGWALRRYELGEIWSSGWGSSMVWAELLSNRGTWHSRMVGGAWWSGAVGGEGAGGRRLEEAVEGGRGRPEEGRDRKKGCKLWTMGAALLLILQTFTAVQHVSMDISAPMQTGRNKNGRTVQNVHYLEPHETWAEHGIPKQLHKSTEETEECTTVQNGNAAPGISVLHPPTRTHTTTHTLCPLTLL